MSKDPAWTMLSDTIHSRLNIGTPRADTESGHPLTAQITKPAMVSLDETTSSRAADKL